MVDFVVLAATAKRLIDANGRDVTLVKHNAGDAVPAQPWRARATPDTTIGPFKAVLVPFKASDIDGELVRRGDLVGFLAAVDAGSNEVDTFDELVDSGDTWKIINAEVINPGDTRVLYTLQLRR